MRDGFTCPIGARWMVSFWSPQPLNDALSAATRAALYMVASSAAMRLEELLSPGAGGIADQPHLTPRELAVLRSASLGRKISATACVLGLSPETVRTHVKKAHQKLGTRTITHAVAESMRWRFFPLNMSDRCRDRKARDLPCRAFNSLPPKQRPSRQWRACQNCLACLPLSLLMRTPPPIG
jgi:DNA-binding CsgD family transcriptional regulator